MTWYRNLSRGDLVFVGKAYPPGALIPEEADPGQLQAFLDHGIVEVAEAPLPAAEPMRRRRPVLGTEPKPDGGEEG